MQTSAKKKPRNLSTSYTMNNSSSFITLPNGTVKRKRHKASYKDIYLEQFNFIATEMPPDKKVLIQQNKSVMLASSKKLNETDASFKSRNKAKQMSTNNNNSNSLHHKGSSNKHNGIKSMKGKSITTNKQMCNKKKGEEMILSSLGTDRSFEQKMKMHTNDNEHNVEGDKRNLPSFILSAEENKDKLLTGSLMDKHEHDLDDTEMMHEITDRLNNAIKQQEEKECNELGNMNNGDDDECENDKNGKKGKRRKVHFENDNCNNNNEIDHINDGDVNGNCNSNSNTKDIKKSNLKESFKCGKDNDVDNNKGGDSNDNDNNKEHLDGDNNNDNLVKDDPILNNVNSDQLNANSNTNEKQKTKRNKKRRNNCSNENEEYDDNITNDHQMKNSKGKNNQDGISINEENTKEEDKTNEQFKNDPKFKDPSYTHQTENEENNLNVNNTNEQQNIQNQTNLPSNTKTISTQTEYDISSTLKPYPLQITTINVELNEQSSKTPKSNTLITPLNQQQLNTEENPKIYSSNTINVTSRISNPFSSKKQLRYGINVQKSEEDIDIIDSFINKHRHKNKNKSDVLLELKQQTEIELRVLKEKSTLIAKEKKENIKRKKEKKQILTKDILNSNKKKSFDINSHTKTSIVTKSESNNDKYQSRCNTMNYNETTTNFDTIYQKTPYVSIFTSFNKASLNTRNQTLKGNLVKNYNQLSERSSYKYKGIETESDVSNIEIYERLRTNSITLENDVISCNKRKNSNTFLNKVKEDVKGIEMKKGIKEKYNSKFYNNIKFKHTEKVKSNCVPKGRFTGGVVMPANSLEELIESRDLYFFNNKTNPFCYLE